MIPAPPHLDFEAWKDQIRKMGGRFDPQVIDPKAFAGWVRPISAYGLTAAEVGSNAHVVERTHRDVRVAGADHYVVLFQLAGRSAVAHNEEAVRFGVGDIVLVDAGRPATFFAGNAGEFWNTMALVLPRQALVSHLGFEPRGGLHRRNGTVVGRLLLDLIRNAGEEEVPPSRTECYVRLAVHDLVGALFAPGDPAPVTQHTDPSGAVFQWSDVNFQFRLRTWREGSSDVQTVVNAVSGITSGSNTIQGLFNNFNPNSAARSAVRTTPDFASGWNCSCLC